MQSHFYWSRLCLWNQIEFNSISVQQITVLPWIKLFCFSKQWKTGYGQLCLACSWFTFSHVSAASSSYIYFNSIHIVKFRTIEGFIDCIVLLRVLEILSEEKKRSCRTYHWVFNGCPWVLGSRCYYWKKLCGARSRLLEAYMVNSHVEPTHKCNNMKEEMLLYQINIVILRWLLKH